MDPKLCQTKHMVNLDRTPSHPGWDLDGCVSQRFGSEPLLLLQHMFLLSFARFALVVIVQPYFSLKEDVGWLADKKSSYWLDNYVMSLP